MAPDNSEGPFHVTANIGFPSDVELDLLLVYIHVHGVEGLGVFVWYWLLRLLLGFEDVGWVRHLPESGFRSPPSLKFDMANVLTCSRKDSNDGVLCLIFSWRRPKTVPMSDVAPSKLWMFVCTMWFDPRDDLPPLPMLLAPVFGAFGAGVMGFVELLIMCRNHS